MRGLLHNRPRQRVAGSSLRRGRQGQQLIFGTRQRQNPEDGEPAFRDRSRFVKDDHIGLGRALQHGRAAHQDAAPRQSAHRRHHRGGSGQDERARAGDDEYRHGTQPVARDEEREPGRQEKGGKEKFRIAVRQTFHRRAPLLRFLDQFDDARQRGIRPAACHANPQQGVSVERAREHLVAGDLS